MLIRSEQIAQIETSMRSEYWRRVMRGFQKRHPEITERFDEAQLLNIIVRAAETAGRYGISGGEPTMKFIAMAVLIDPNFDEEPAVQRFLSHPDLDPDAKICMLAKLTAKKLLALVG